MDSKNLLRATKHWGPFALRTMGYGTLSVTLGPFTPERKASTWAMRQWCRSSTKALGISVVFDGEENIPSNEAFVYCSNHQSIVDIIVLGAVLPGDFKWAAKRSVMRIPFLGWHLSISGHVPVDRNGGPKSAAKVIARFEETLKKGKPLLIFPEGTRTRDGQVKPFKKGGFRAATRASVPVIPIAIEGTFSLMKKGALDLENEEKKVYVRAGEPIFPREKLEEKESIKDLSDRTFAAVQKLHAGLQEEIARKTL